MRRACAEVLTVHHCVQSQGLMAETSRLRRASRAGSSQRADVICALATMRGATACVCPRHFRIVAIQVRRPPMLDLRIKGWRRAAAKHFADPDKARPKGAVRKRVSTERKVCNSASGRGTSSFQ